MDVDSTRQNSAVLMLISSAHSTPVPHIAVILFSHLELASCCCCCCLYVHTYIHAGPAQPLKSTHTVKVQLQHLTPTHVQMTFVSQPRRNNTIAQCYDWS